MLFAKTEDKSTFQISMEAARVNAKLTQEEAGRQIGVSRATIINWERGKRIPTLPHLIRMSEVYEIPVNNIFLPVDSTKSRLEGG